MKWIMLLGSFVLHTVLGTIGIGLLMLSQMRNSYGGIFVMYAAPLIGAVFGLVGIGSGYYVYKKEYSTAVTITIVFGIAFVFFVQMKFF